MALADRRLLGLAGLMLAGELTLAGVDVAIVARGPTPELVGSRAGGFHSRTIEVLDQRGIADRLLAQAKTYLVPYAAASRPATRTRCSWAYRRVG